MHLNLAGSEIGWSNLYLSLFNSSNIYNDSGIQRLYISPTGSITQRSRYFIVEKWYIENRECLKSGRFAYMGSSRW